MKKHCNNTPYPYVAWEKLQLKCKKIKKVRGSNRTHQKIKYFHSSWVRNNWCCNYKYDRKKAYCFKKRTYTLFIHNHTPNFFFILGTNCLETTIFSWLTRVATRRLFFAFFILNILSKLAIMVFDIRENCRVVKLSSIL